jgi:uncharacterized protein YoxC
MNTQDRERVMALKRQIALLRKQTSDAIDKQLLLLNQVIDLKAERDRLADEIAEMAVSYQRCIAQREDLYKQINDPDRRWRNEGFEKWRADRA